MIGKQPGFKPGAVSNYLLASYPIYWIIAISQTGQKTELGGNTLYDLEMFSMSPVLLNWQDQSYHYPNIVPQGSYYRKTKYEIKAEIMPNNTNPYNLSRNSMFAYVIGDIKVTNKMFKKNLDYYQQEKSNEIINTQWESFLKEIFP